MSGERTRNLWLICGAAVAAGILASLFAPHSASAGTLDAVKTTFETTALSLDDIAASWSKTIFATIAIFEFLWVLTEGALFESSLEGWLNTFVFRLILFACGLWLVNNQVPVAKWAVTEITTIANAFSPAGTTLTPDAIGNLGFADSLKLMNSENPGGNFLVGVGLVIPQFIVGTVMQLAFSIVAVELLVVTIAVQLCVAIGSLLLGFTGTRWTRHIAAMWPRMLVMTLLLLVTVNAIATVGTTLSDNIIVMIDKAGNAGQPGLLATMSEMMADCLVYVGLALGLPGIVGFLGASTPMTAGTTLKSMAMGAASFAGARMGGGGGTGSTAATISRSGSTTLADIEAATRLPNE